jgi:hypothetical protein
MSLRCTEEFLRRLARSETLRSADRDAIARHLDQGEWYHHLYSDERPNGQTTEVFKDDLATTSTQPDSPDNGGATSRRDGEATSRTDGWPSDQITAVSPESGREERENEVEEMLLHLSMDECGNASRLLWPRDRGLLLTRARFPRYPTLALHR